MNLETKQTRTLQALEETFRRWGWDSSVPKMLADWGVREEVHFSYTDKTFRLEIQSSDWHTQVSLRILGNRWGGVLENYQARVETEDPRKSGQMAMEFHPVNFINAERPDPDNERDQEALFILGTDSTWAVKITSDGLVRTYSLV